MKNHPLIPEGYHILTITEVEKIINRRGEEITTIKFAKDNLFTLLTVNFNDGLYSIKRARSLLHSLNVEFTHVTHELLKEQVGKKIYCQIYHKEYTPNPEIKIARINF